MVEKKPDVQLRDNLEKRAEKAKSGRKTPSPSQKRSENFKKKLRSKDGWKCPPDFKEPEVLKDVG
jgi:hypothetical protein